ncbi:DUF192 domain-containing protein [Nanoarchaeota archaeon]
MLINKTKNKVLAKKIHNCKSILSKSIGCMFSLKSTLKNKALIFHFSKPQIISLHMFFVFYPIDVLFIKNNRIVEIKENFLPFTFYTPKNKADMVIELPKDMIKKTITKLNDTIAFNTSLE